MTAWKTEEVSRKKPKDDILKHRYPISMCVVQIVIQHEHQLYRKGMGRDMTKLKLKSGIPTSHILCFTICDWLFWLFR